MLFYQTEGEFGDENFKIIAKSLFLLDIGTATYTEYDPGDPELIKYLMANPEVLPLKKGHIHSHNNMGVFFSGTDNDELADNSGFHNFYVSLIVNNKNEMCAKIAFKAKTSSENNITMTFADQNGKEKQKKLVSKKEDECIYVYKCEVFKPTEEAVEDSFKSRFQELREAKEIKEKAKRISESATRERAFGGFNVDERWRQAGLFDDVKGSSSIPKGKKDEPTYSSGSGVSVVERVGNMRTDPRIYTMLVKLLAQDFLCEGTLSSLIKKLDEQFFSSDGVAQYSYYQLNTYCDAIERRAVEFYIDSFPEDCQKLLFFNSVMTKCVEILETYEDEYPEIISNLTEALNLEIK